MNTEAEAVAAIVEDQKLSEVVTLDSGVEVLVTRGSDGGTEAQSVKPFTDAYLTEPERKRGNAVLSNLDSFIAHANREKLEHSAVFLHETGPTLKAVYDYQEPGKGEPRFHEHTATYAFPVSDEWKAWTGLSGQLISQSEFAEFLEDHLTEVVDNSTLTKRDDVEALEEATGGHCATPQQLLEVSRGLKVHASRGYANHETLSSGETQFQFEETHTAIAKSGPIKVPTCFVISIPVFRSGAIYTMAVKLRYRVGERSVLWGFALFKPEKRIEDALAEAASRVVSETGLPVFYGTPEVNTK